MDLNFVRRHWWSVYIVLNAILTVPFPNPTLTGNSQSRLLLTLVMVLGGALLTATAHPDLNFGDFKKILPFSKIHKAPFIALCFGFWSIISAFVSEKPIVGLMGSLQTGLDGAFWTLLLSFVFFLVYFEIVRDSKINQSLINSMAGLIVFFTLAALLEILFKKSLIFPGARFDLLPLLNIGSNGHLSGFLVLLTGGFYSFLSSNFQNTLLFILFAVFGISLSSNKSSIIALSVLSGYYFILRQYKIAAISLSIVILGFFVTVNFVNWYNQSEKRNFSEQSQYLIRIVSYKIALKGILRNPIFGYGGSQFDNRWMDSLSESEIKEYFKYFFSDFTYISGSRDKENGIFFFSLLNKEKKLEITSVYEWKAHNQFLDVTLMWGLIGLFFYVVLIMRSFKNLFKENYFSISIFAYLIFNLFWFVHPNIEGTFFVILGASCIPKES
jgi:hypothetical protein